MLIDIFFGSCENSGFSNIHTRFQSYEQIDSLLRTMRNAACVMIHNQIHRPVQHISFGRIPLFRLLGHVFRTCPLMGHIPFSCRFNRPIAKTCRFLQNDIPLTCPPKVISVEELAEEESWIACSQDQHRY